jgi:hypothetical protein
VRGRPAQSWDLIPTPQYVEPCEGGVPLDGAGPIRVVIPHAAASQTALAARFIREGLAESFPSLAARISIGEDSGSFCSRRDAQRTPHGVTTHGVVIRLVEWRLRGDQADPPPLNLLDEQVLARHYGHAYVLRTLDAERVVLVGPPLGLVYGAMTLLQLAGADGGPPTIPGVYIRDFPHFEHRAASCWLMNGEANRWSLDRGQGLAAFEALCRRKLDLCLRYKINMVVFDGFGFGLAQRFPEYPAMMRRLNRYARERGIRLVFGGYGAGYGIAYQPGPLYEEAGLQGTVWLNRAHYPDGPTYKCLGYPRTRAGLEPGLFGTCRSNEDLNRLKAEELAAFVEAVEPGALYIHHEDFGGFDTTQRYWLERCDGCRRRWPNDDAASADGAAGAIAHGYASLIRSVNAVRHADTGYDAARDCLIILTSPIYMPSSPMAEDWNKVLWFWQNVARALPAAENLTVCFREVFPQRIGGTRWVDAFNAAMTAAPRPLGLWIYFAGGADHWLNDYPFVGTPALNALFLGAQGLYNASGDAYQEPQQLLNAEYDWNVHSAGFFLEPRSHDEAEALWRGLAQTDVRPAALFGPGGFLERACRRLYGEAAASPMVRHFGESVPVAPAGGEPASEKSAVGDEQAQLAAVETRKTSYLPMAYDRIYGVPVHWRRLALDSKTWGDEIRNEVFARRFAECGISRAELHARLRRQWDLVRQQTERSMGLVDEALSAGPRPSSREDLEFLRRHLAVTVPLCRALVAFHEALRLRHIGPSGREADRLTAALRTARQEAETADALVCEAFPAVTDPAGAEVGGLRARIAELRAAILQTTV